jgi:hypothetical protein
MPYSPPWNRDGKSVSRDDGGRRVASASLELFQFEGFSMEAL